MADVLAIGDAVTHPDVKYPMRLAKRLYGGFVTCTWQRTDDSAQMRGDFPSHELTKVSTNG